MTNTDDAAIFGLICGFVFGLITGMIWGCIHAAKCMKMTRDRLEKKYGKDQNTD